VKKLTRGQKVCAFIERYLVVAEGDLIGKPVRLEPFQRKFIIDVYDNPTGTRRAFLSIARKNGKTALIAALLLAHIVGPEAKLNSRIISGAMSKEQAAEVYNYASKMIGMSEELSKLCRVVPSGKRIIGLARNVEYQAVSAEGKTAHGKSPILAILDEVGQVRGPQSDFVDAITTAQGAYTDAMLFAISTQAPNDNDLFSIWLDDARESKDKRIVCHLYAAQPDAKLNDAEAWKAANPALGKFRSLPDVQEQADRAARMPSFEPTFRNLVLNQRVEMSAPFISRGVWILNSGPVDDSVFYRCPVYVGLDLSGKNDLTAMVMIADDGEKWHVRPTFWVPEKGLRDRAKRDRAPYDVWYEKGHLRAVHGASINYADVARDIVDLLTDCDVRVVGFDRWRFDLLQKELNDLAIELPLRPFGQGFRDMAPALDIMESALLNERVAHGGHPVLQMCAANSRIEQDAAGNRKLSKAKATGRIDGMVAMAMAFGCTAQLEEVGDFEGAISSPLML
jgi:phage terminase large subunit-like protein